MKHVSTLFLIMLILASCTKELHQPEDRYVQNVQAALKERMQASDFTTLDFTRAVLSKADSAALYLLRVPFQGKALRTDFILVKTDKEGRVQLGKVVHLEGRSAEFGEGTIKKRRFEGHITLSSLDRKAVLHSRITNGLVEAFHRSGSTRMESLMPSGEDLPEIIVIGYYYDNSLSYSNWYNLEKFLYDSGDAGFHSGYYESLEGGGDGGGYSGGSGSSGDYDYDGGVVLDPPILIDYENQDGLDPIDVKKYLNCFNSIPDEGASCSIEIFADIPVDSDPNMIFDFNSGSPGHTFIQIKKSNGSQSAIQNIGFYPESGWKTILTNAPITGKFVDNGLHEFNASLKMNLSPENFRSTIIEIEYLANFIEYDIDNYNCTDFALDVFNKTRTSKLIIDLYDIPGNYPSTGTRTPQSLFNKLRQMQESNHPEASNISMSNFKCWVATSSGPCN